MARLRIRTRGRSLAALVGLVAAACALAPSAAHAQTTDTTAPVPVALADHARKITLPGQLPGVTAAPWDLTVTPNAVWVLEPRAGMVFRVSPESNRVVARVKLPAPGCVPRTCPGNDRIVADDRSVWVINNQAGTLVHIDARTNKVRKSIPITTPTFLPPLAEAGGVWYAPDPSTGDLAFLDPATDAVTKTVHVGVAPVWPVAMVGDTLWAASAVDHGPGAAPDEALYRIDPRAAAVVATAPGLSGNGAVLGSELWLNRFCCPLVTHVDAAGAVVANVHVDGFSDFFTAGGGAIWARMYSQDFARHWITRVDANDGSTELLDLPTTELSGGVAFGHHSLWVTNWNENAIYRMPVPVR